MMAFSSANSELNTTGNPFFMPIFPNLFLTAFARLQLYDFDMSAIFICRGSVLPCSHGGYDLHAPLYDVLYQKNFRAERIDGVNHIVEMAGV